MKNNEIIKKILELLNIFGVTTTDKIKNIVIIIVTLISLFNLQVNVKTENYGYFNEDTTSVVKIDSTATVQDTIVKVEPVKDSTKVDSIK